MIAPTRRGALLVALTFPASLLPLFWRPSAWIVWALSCAMVAAVFLADAWLMSPEARFDVTWRFPPLLHVGEEARLTLLVASRWRVPLHVEIAFDWDGTLLAETTRVVHVPAREAVTVDVPLVARRRGTLRVDALWLRWRGPLRLVERVRRRSLDLSVPVVPNMLTVRRAALRFFTRRQFVSGSRMERYVGEGSEFESIREFVPGLDTRSLDWKASARRRKLLARDFRAERDRQVMLVFDTGHLMSEPLGTLPRLDHALHAGLLLGYVALKSGDRVGLAAFDDRPQAFLDPRRGPLWFGRLRAESAALRYSGAETNYARGLLETTRRLTRRTLVIVLTDFVDSVTAELMVDHLGRLARRHLILFVALRDTLVDRTIDRTPRHLDDLGRAVVARTLARERDAVMERLRRRGIQCLDAAPERISTDLVNKYLDIRRREQQ